MRFVMRVLYCLDTRQPVIDLPNEQPFATGSGSHDYVCGRCGNVLFARLELPNPPKVTVICGKCRTLNGMAFREATSKLVSQ